MAGGQPSVIPLDGGPKLSDASYRGKHRAFRLRQRWPMAISV